MLDGDNGHDPVGIALDKAVDQAVGQIFPGARVGLSQLEKEDGIIAKAAENIGRNSAGVLQRSMSAVENDEHYRQALKIAYWDNPQQYVKTCAAIAECRLCHDIEGLRMIVDVVTAQSAGIKGGLLNAIFNALTHTTFNANVSGKKDAYDKQKHSSSFLS